MEQFKSSSVPYAAWQSRSTDKPRIAIVGEEEQDSEGGACTGLCKVVLVIVSIFLALITFPVSLAFIIKVS